MNAVPVVLFALAASLGLWMAARHFRGNPSPPAWGLLHGLFAVAGMIILAAIIPQFHHQTWGWIALGLYIGAAIGGAFLFVRQKRGKPWPGVVVLIHGAVAVTAFVVLLIWLTGGAS